MTTNGKVEKIFNMLYENRYQGLGTGTLWFDLNGIIASDENFQNASFHEKFVKELLKVSKYDIEFYTRSMNYSIQESLTYLEYFFMKCSLLLLYNKYNGMLDNLYDEPSLFCRNVYGTIYKNTIEIILDGDYQEEIDISENTGKIYIGKNPRSIIYPNSSKILTDYKFNILDLVYKKYVKETMDICENSGENKLLNQVRKLNFIYQQMNDLSEAKTFPFSVNSEDLFPQEENLNEEKYDELLYTQYNILFLPLINDVKILGDKISVFNEGYGCLSNGVLFILHNGEIIDYREINISHDKSDDFYINEKMEKVIRKEDPNNIIEFKLVFQKFGREYAFIFNKKIGIIKATLKPDTGESMNTIHIETMIGSTLVNESREVNISNNYSKDNLSEYYKQLIDKLDDLEMEKNKKETVKEKFHQVLGEIERANTDYNIVKKLTLQAFGIIGSHINNPLLCGIAFKLKEILGP
ncbi:hypothetical protein RSJ42_05920 [Methanosarcina hadiensis]|uniref:hypothetical protein n=1 Tax=Methanosarcina hadiensis TaxID=3078083 RepID=UPI0039778B05